MKLRQREIEIISKHITDALLDGGYVQTEDKENLTASIVRVIHDDLQVEDRLNEEVRQLLASHSSEIERSQVEYHRVFNMVKAKLIKERNLIL